MLRVAIDQLPKILRLNLIERRIGMKKRKTTPQREEVNAKYRASLEFWKKTYPIDEKKIPSPKVYGENVQIFRNRAKLSQAAVGKMLGISAETVSCIEKGARKKLI